MRRILAALVVLVLTDCAPAPSNSELKNAQALRDAAAKIPASAYDFDAYAASQPDDVTALFHNVRDQIGTEVYGGALRGAQGTLLAGTANPTDRVLFLAALLAAKHLPVSFVHGTLSDAEIGQIIAHDDNAGTNSRDAETGTGTLPADQQNAVDATLAANAKIADSVAAALGLLGAPLAQKGRVPNRALLKSHWWLRVQTAGGTAQDLDPTLPRLEPGAHLGTADGAAPIAALPTSEYATLRVRVVARNDRGVESDIVDRVMRVADAPVAPIRMWFLPPDAGADPRGSTTLVPRFAMGNTINRLAPVKLHNADGSSLAGVRLEFVSAQPGMPPRSYRRTLFGPSDARTGSLVHLAGVFDLLVQNGTPNAAFLMASSCESMARIYFFYGIRKTIAGKAVAPSNLPLPLRALFFYARDGYFAQAIEAQHPSVRFAYDRPQLIMQRSWYGHNGGALMANSIFDIVDNGSDVYGTAGPKANLLRGIVDTQLERDISSATPLDAYDLLTQNYVATVLRTAPPPSDAARAGVAGTIANGNVAVALAAPVQSGGTSTFAWWDVDPKTGNAVGRLTGGAGASMVETALPIDNTAMYGASLWNDLGGCVRGRDGCLSGACASFVDTLGLLTGLKATGAVKGIASTVAGVPLGLGYGAVCGGGD